MAATAQLSPIAGSPNATLVATQLAFAEITTSAGQVIVGLVVSRTITRCTQLLLLPLVSVTTHLTRFVPWLKNTGASLVTVATAQLSAVVGAPSETFVAPQPALAETTMSAGQAIVGFVVSRTTTR